MNLSDLIPWLIRIQETHGDLPIYIYNDAFDTEHLMDAKSLVIKSGADPDKEYLIRPSPGSSVWKKRVLIE